VSLKCIIVDDEPLAIKLIDSYTDKIDGIEAVSSFTNPLEAIKYLRSNPVDVIFLDIQMPEISGLDVAKIVEKNIKVIFTTAYPNHAAEGFELNATDYLVKPISFVRFVDSIDRILNNQKNDQISSNNKDYLFVKTEYRLKKIDVKSVIYLKGTGDYCKIIMEKENIMTLEKLKSFEERLPSTKFARVHKSFIVNIEKINFIEKSRIHIHDEIIPIGSTYEEQFKKLLK